MSDKTPVKESVKEASKQTVKETVRENEESPNPMKDRISSVSLGVSAALGLAGLVLSIYSTTRSHSVDVKG